jgi:hypothetical protein
MTADALVGDAWKAPEIPPKTRYTDLLDKAKTGLASSGAVLGVAQDRPEWLAGGPQVARDGCGHAPVGCVGEAGRVGGEAVGFGPQVDPAGLAGKSVSEFV